MIAYKPEDEKEVGVQAQVNQAKRDYFLAALGQFLKLMLSSDWLRPLSRLRSRYVIGCIPNRVSIILKTYESQAGY